MVASLFLDKIFVLFLLLGKNFNICEEKLDIGFILDSSGSIGAFDFEKIKSFVKDLTDHFNISHENTRVSVISYATSCTLHFPFSQIFETREDLHSAIQNISFTSGITNTDLALVKAYTEMFKANNGARFSGLSFSFVHFFVSSFCI